MKTCKSCGHENGDDDKFCAGCGSPLQEDEPQKRTCPKCGAEVPQDTEFCGECGAPVNEVKETEPVHADEEPKAEATAADGKGKGVKAKITAARAKTMAFEKKHSIIVNALIAVCAIVIMFVSLFAPIKVMAYSESKIQDSGFESGSEEVTYHYMEIDQSVWKMLGAIGCIGIDTSTPDGALKYKELKDEANKALREAQNEFRQWAMEHPGASQEEALEAQEDIIADHLSDVNYLALMIAANSAGGFEALFQSKNGLSAFISLVFALVVTLLSFVIAIVSIVYLIFAIIGMVKKKSDKSLYNYLGKMMGLTVSGMTLLVFAPMTKPGGAMFAIFLFAAIMFLVIGAGSSFIIGKSGIAVTIKKSAIALIGIIATCLLFTNVCAYISGKSTINVPFGYGVYMMFSVIDAGQMSAMAFPICMIAIALFGMIVISCAMKGTIASLKSLAGVTGKDDYEKSLFNNFLAAAIVSILMIVFAFVGTPNIAKAISGVAPKDLEYLVRAQVYVAAVFFLAIAIFAKAFKPVNKPMFADETADGAAQEQPAAAEEQPHAQPAETDGVSRL